MQRREPLPKLCIAALALSAVFFASPARGGAAAWQNEQQSQPQQQNPPAQDPPNSAAPQPKDPGDVPGALPIKRRKVWTNDEVVTLRTAADNYQAAKEDKEAAEVAAAAKEAAIRAAAKSGKSSTAPEFQLPATVEETQKMIKDTEDDVQELTVVLDKMRQELPDAPEEAQPEKEKEIEHVTLDQAKARRKLKALQDHLQALTAKREVENPAEPPPQLF